MSFSLRVAGKTVLVVCFTQNLLNHHQHAGTPEQRKAGFRRPTTLRAAVFISGAVPGTRSRTPMLYGFKSLTNNDFRLHSQTEEDSWH